MLEQKLEKKVIDKIESTLSKANLLDIVKVIGTWQAVDEEQLKCTEEEQTAIVTVKAFPRSYATPTIADATINFEVNILVRSDVDYNGKSFLEVVSYIASIFQKWQKSYDMYKDDFEIEGNFTPTGFQQDGGDVGNDATNKLWTYSMTFTLNGIICWNEQL